jgi:hypothetical protein
LSFGCSNILYTYGMVCLIPSFYLSIDFFFLYIMYMFLGLGQKAWHPCLLWAFPFICWFFFSFSFIVYMHLSLGQEAQPPLFFGSFFFHLLVIFSFVLLYCVHAYQNQCYMCTKIGVIQWLPSSGRLVFWKNSCNFDGVPIRHAILKIAC